jgi:hypothetical protein
MAVIECNEINQTINELLIAFQDCKTIKNTDLIKLVELVSAVNVCANGGADYSTLIEEVYEPIADELVSYPVDTFHSISINVIEGSIEKQVGIDTITFPVGSSLSVEFTTLNQVVYEFTVKAGAKVFVEYIIETI